MNTNDGWVLAEEAKERQLANLKQYSEPNTVKEKIPEREQEKPEPQARDKAASIVGNTNARYVQDAKKIEREAPEVKELVMAGTVNMADAVKLTKLEPDKRAVAVERIKPPLARARCVGGFDNIVETSGSPLARARCVGR